MKYKYFYYICIFIFFLSSETVFSQNAATSLKTKMLLKQQSFSAHKAASAGSDSIENENYLQLTIMVSENFQRSSLNSINAIIESDFGTFINISIPEKNLQALTELKDIEYIRAGMPVKPRLDLALPMIYADSVKNGTSLEQAYTGEGVVVGIVDTGLDFTHPNFRSSDGNDLRISRAWIQSERGTNHPSDFSYGVEYKGTNALLTKEYSNDQQSHGSHVTGIAAGNGDNTPYVGVASDAEIVFVEMGETDAQITDAVNYIFNYAKSVNKPAVVNLSLGSQYGPHDGNSFIDQAFDKLVGPGKIIVGSAGNEGNLNLHIQHFFTSSSDTLRTLIDIDTYDNTKFESSADIWGEVSANIVFRIELYDLSTKQIVHTSNIGNTSSGSDLNNKWIMNANDTIQVQLSSVSKYPLNNKPNIEVYIKNPVYQTYGVVVVLTGSDEKHLDIWNAGVGYGAELKAITGTTTGGWHEGDTNYSVGEIGGTSKSIITVGAYTSKKTWTNIAGNNTTIGGEIGNITAWSSKGPTADGRTKPEITAPGAVVASSVNSYDAAFKPTGDYKNNLVYQDNDLITHPYFFAVLQGTSMSSPIVTGAIALMLQKNPELSPDDIKLLLKKYADQDEMTGIIGENGSNTWGWGKLDLFKIMKSKDIEPKPKLKDLIVYYNVESKEIGIKTEFDVIDKIEIYNVVGSKMREIKNITDKKIDASLLKDGIYILKIYVGNENTKKKMLIF